MSLLANSNAIESGGYNIDRSLRFRSSASAYLSRTPASAGNQQKFTWSGWVKRGQLASVQRFLSAGAGGGDAKIGFLSGDTLQFQDDNTGANVITTQVFRDPSAWYHIIYAVDSTQATAANRILLYVNGVNVTAFATATYMAQNSNSYFDSANAHYIGRRYSGGEQLDGYLAEVNFIDGQALTPSSFGETSTETGVWTPKKYTGTYGTNGFYLDFKDNTSATTLAYDKSGNGNNWTPNNISTTAGATYDSMTDVPTLTSATAANYCVLNPNFRGGTQPTVSGGNLNIAGAGNYGYSAATFDLTTSGKWYWEAVITAASTALNIGIMSYNPGNADGSGANNVSFNGAGYIANEGTFALNGSAPTFSTGTVVGMSFDSLTGAFQYTVNGSTYFTVATKTPDGRSWFPKGTVYASGDSWAFNFGQRPFSFSAPSGFLPLNTYNLP